MKLTKSITTDSSYIYIFDKKEVSMYGMETKVSSLWGAQFRRETEMSERSFYLTISQENRPSLHISYQRANKVSFHCFQGMEFFILKILQNIFNSPTWRVNWKMDSPIVSPIFSLGSNKKQKGIELILRCEADRPCQNKWV